MGLRGQSPAIPPPPGSPSFAKHLPKARSFVSCLEPKVRFFAQKPRAEGRRHRRSSTVWGNLRWQLEQSRVSAASILAPGPRTPCYWGEGAASTLAPSRRRSDDCVRLRLSAASPGVASQGPSLDQPTPRERREGGYGHGSSSPSFSLPRTPPSSSTEILTLKPPRPRRRDQPVLSIESMLEVELPAQLCVRGDGPPTHLREAVRDRSP